MRAATFNVNSIRTRLDAVMTWLQTHSPDILCLQETKVTDDDFPAAPFRDMGYHVVYRGEKSYNGVAIVTRREPDDVSFGFDDDGPSDASRLAYIRLGTLHVFNTYVPQGRAIDHAMYAYKLQWFQRLQALFEARMAPDQDVLWMGDMNVAPDVIDIHNAEKQTSHVCYHAEVRAAFERTTAWGFVDLLRAAHPGERLYTFYDYRTPNAVKRGMGWRIDHIMATAPMADHCRDCRIDLSPRLAERPSDHTVLLADFTD